jgi:hypothetical protein
MQMYAQHNTESFTDTAHRSITAPQQIQLIKRSLQALEQLLKNHRTKKGAIIWDGNAMPIRLWYSSSSPFDKDSNWNNWCKHMDASAIFSCLSLLY